MKYLLDTHAFIWYSEEDIFLPNKLKLTIENNNNEIFISIVSLWEITIKTQIGKLKINKTIDEIIFYLSKNNIQIININNENLKILFYLPLHHRDPFDRMLISQAISENLIFITKDKNIYQYQNVKTLW